MNTPKTRRPNRGQATVEMAVVMVALIPTFLYVLTADDLLRYRLNLQEVVVASPWNYTHLDYEGGPIPGNALVGDLRRRYLNTNNTYSMHYSAPPTENKTAPMTFAGWDVDNTGNQNELSCREIPNFFAQNDANNHNALPVSAFAREVNHGGIYSCDAKLNVRNMLLVNRFMQSWAGDMNVTDKAQGVQAWGLNRQSFSVMADTWALKTVENVEPKKADHEKPLRQRVQAVYQSPAFPYNKAVLNALNYVVGGQEVFNLSILADKDNNGDGTHTAEVGFSNRFSPRPKTETNNNFESSPWSIPAAVGTQKQAFGNRTDTYMGRPLPPQ